MECGAAHGALAMTTPGDTTMVTLKEVTAGDAWCRRKNRKVRKMTKQEVAKRISEVGIVPVVRAASAKQGMLAAEAVCAGGIPYCRGDDDSARRDST